MEMQDGVAPLKDDFPAPIKDDSFSYSKPTSKLKIVDKTKNLAKSTIGRIG